MDEVLSASQCDELMKAGFPQDVDEGDWVLMPQPIGGDVDDLGTYGFRLVTEDICPLNHEETVYIYAPTLHELILWLESKGFIVESRGPYPFGLPYHTILTEGDGSSLRISSGLSRIGSLFNACKTTKVI